MCGERTGGVRVRAAVRARTIPTYMGKYFWDLVLRFLFERTIPAEAGNYQIRPCSCMRPCISRASRFAWLSVSAVPPARVMVSAPPPTLGITSSMYQRHWLSSGSAKLNFALYSSGLEIRTVIMSILVVGAPWGGWTIPAHAGNIGQGT